MLVVDIDPADDFDNIPEAHANALTPPFTFSNGVMDFADRDLTLTSTSSVIYNEDASRNTTMYNESDTFDLEGRTYEDIGSFTSDGAILVDGSITDATIPDLLVYNDVPSDTTTTFSASGINFTSTVFDVAVSSGTTRVVVFNNCTFSGVVINVTDGGTLFLVGGDSSNITTAGNVLNITSLALTVAASTTVTVYDITGDTAITNSNLSSKRMNSTPFTSSTTLVSSNSDYSDLGGSITKVLIVGSASGRDSSIQEVDVPASADLTISVGTTANTSFNSGADFTGTITSTIGHNW